MNLKTIVTIIKPGAEIRRTAWIQYGWFLVFNGVNAGGDPVYDRHRRKGEVEAWRPTKEDLDALDWEVMY